MLTRRLFLGATIGSVVATALTPAAFAASIQGDTTSPIVILDDWPFYNDPSEIGHGMPVIASALRGSASSAN